MLSTKLPLRTALLAAALMTGASLAQGLLQPAHSTSTAPLIEYGEPVNGSLTDQDGQNYKDGARVKAYAFQGEEGETVHIRLGSDDFDTYLSLFDPNGIVLEWNDDDWENYGSGFAWNSTLVAELSESGLYTVVVSGYSAWDYGDFQLSVDEGPAVSLRDFSDAVALQVPGELAVPITSDMPPTGDGFSGPSQLFTFDVAEDLLVRAHATSETLDPVLLLYDADGVLITFNDDRHDSANEAAWLDSQITAELAPGTYYLVAGTYSESWDPSDQELLLTVSAFRRID